MKLIVTAPLVLLLDGVETGAPNKVVEAVVCVASPNASAPRVAAVLSGKRAHRAVRTDVGRFARREKRHTGKPSASA